MTEMLAVVHMRYGGGPEGDKLHQIFRKYEIQGPIQHDPELLFHPWELAQINRSPQPPGEKAGEVHPQDVGNARALANRSELSQGRKDKGLFLPPTHGGGDVTREHLAFAQG